MMKFLIVIPLCYLLHLAHGGEPVVNCTAPRSPEHGQAFLYQAGKVVKYVCEPGYVLRGKELVRCVDGKWEDELVTCLKMDDDSTLENFPVDALKPEAPIPPPRPLFNWEEEDNDTEKSEQNSTSEDDEVPMSDEARLRMVLYPRRRARIVATRIRPARIHSASELEEEEKKRTDAKNVEKTATTIHLEAPPSSIYVRRTISPGKSDSQEQALNQQYRAASVHMTVDNAEDADHVQVVTLPRAAVAQNDKGEDALRQMYWWAHHNYPRHASLVEYRSGNPVAMTLSESQIAWINSLHPELRDQYLRDLYVIRAEEAVEGARAQAFLRRYEDAYNLYHAPYYLRQPVSVIARDPISIYDYSCNQAGSHFVTAPKLPNAHIARYDRRQNPNSPRNHYLSAVYRCNPGYEMLDTRFTELYCSQRRWIGSEPICIPRS